MNNKDFLELIDKRVAEYPELLGDVFKTVAAKWDEMVKAQGERRDSVYLHTIYELLDTISMLHIYNKKNPRMFTNIEACSLMESIKIRFPNGYASKGVSPASIDLLNLFVKSCRFLKWDWDSTFIRDIRNFGPMLEMLYDQYDERKVNE